MTYPTRFAISRLRAVVGMFLPALGAFFLLTLFAPAINRATDKISDLVFPVVSDIRVTANYRTMTDLSVRVGPLDGGGVVVVPAGSQVLYGTFEKYQPCAFQTMTWYERSTSGTIHRVRVVTEWQSGREGTTRPTGENAFGPWYVMDEEVAHPDVQFTTVEHRCGQTIRTTIQSVGRVPAKTSRGSN